METSAKKTPQTKKLPGKPAGKTVRLSVPVTTSPKASALKKAAAASAATNAKKNTITGNNRTANKF